jgi:hypothetical protein
MPVSKKRKKEGKPVQRRASPGTEEHKAHPEGHPEHEKQRSGKRANPFLAQQTQHRGAQRGR